MLQPVLVNFLKSNKPLFFKIQFFVFNFLNENVSFDDLILYADLFLGTAIIKKQYNLKKIIFIFICTNILKILFKF